MFDARTRLSEEVAGEVRSQFGEVVLRNVIPRSVKVSEAPGYGQGSRGALAYFDAARELATRGDFQPHPTTGPIGVSPEVAAQFDKAQNTGQDGD